MSEQTFYTCDLKSNDITCPKMEQCKRYTTIKDAPYESYVQSSAKLYNICFNDNYKLFMENK